MLIFRALLVIILFQCGSTSLHKKKKDEPNKTPDTPTMPDSRTPGLDGANTNAELSPLDRQILEAFLQNDVSAFEEADYLDSTQAEIALGKALFFDTRLSGDNRSSCASCHIPEKGTGDGLSLNFTIPMQYMSRLQLNQGKKGRYGIHVPSHLLSRNTPGLFDKGLKSSTTMFWEGRVARVGHGKIISLNGVKIPYGVSSPLAAQALFPLLSCSEMKGCHPGSLTQAFHSPDQTWRLITSKIVSATSYQSLIKKAYPEVSLGEITIVHLVNAIAAFEASAYRTTGSALNRYMTGDVSALSLEAKEGARLFFGKAKCSQCHTGSNFTDGEYHNIALPLWGPGNSRYFNAPVDVGLFEYTQKDGDLFKFITPSLRGVSKTGPWGHNGSYKKLENFIRHYVTVQHSLDSWGEHNITLPENYRPANSQAWYALWGINRDPYFRSLLLSTADIPDIDLSDEEIEQLVAFLEAL